MTESNISDSKQQQELLKTSKLYNQEIFKFDNEKNVQKLHLDMFQNMLVHI